MRVLFLCNHPTAANTGGHQRLRHLLKAVATAGEITLVYPIEHHVIGPDLAALRPFCEQVHTFSLESLAYQRDPLLPKPIFWTKHKLRYLHPMNSVLMQQMRSTEANAIVANICLQRFDLIWCYRVPSIQMLPTPVTSRVIVDLDDLEHRKLRAQLQLWRDPPHMVPLYWLEFLRLKKLERSLHRLPYEFAVCSAIDKETIGTNAKTWVIPNGIDLPTASASPQQENTDPVLVFVGLMSYEPNADGALFFAQRVLPLIQREIPTVKFLIVGRDPGPLVRRLHDGKSVFVTGTVPDVAEYVRSAAVIVAPIRFGGGTRIKILEALAHRKAVVSTTKGAEGIEVQPGRHLLLADSPEDFAKSCTLLLRDGALRNHLGDQGFRLIRDRYQWEGIERMIAETVLDRATAAPRERRTPTDVGTRNTALDITAIVCTCNRAQTLPTTLKSLAASELPKSVSWEILVVDNNSTDQTREVVEDFCRLYPGRFRYLFEPKPGKSYALNSGIANASGEVLAFVDDDVIVEANWLRNLTVDLQDGEWAGTAGRILPAHTFTLPAWLSWKDCRGEIRADSRGIIYGHFDLGDYPKKLDVDEAPYGANMAFRRSMFKKYGGFLTNLGPSPNREIPRPSEDTELGRRLIKGGERLRYEPSAVVYHPIAQDRFNKAYYLSFWFDFGRASIVERGDRADLHGIPWDYLSLLRRVAEISSLGLRWIFAIQPNKRFFSKCMVWMKAGMMVQLFRRLLGKRGSKVTAAI